MFTKNSGTNFTNSNAFSNGSLNLMKTSKGGFPVLGYISAFLIFLGILGLAEILHTSPSSPFLDIFYDAVVLASVNAPFILWGVLFLNFIPRIFLVFLSLIYFLFAVIIFYVISTQSGATILASSVVVGLILLALTSIFSYITSSKTTSSSS